MFRVYSRSVIRDLQTQPVVFNIQIDAYLFFTVVNGVLYQVPGNLSEFQFILKSLRRLRPAGSRQIKTF